MLLAKPDTTDALIENELRYFTLEKVSDVLHDSFDTFPLEAYPGESKETKLENVLRTITTIIKEGVMTQVGYSIQKFYITQDYHNKSISNLIIHYAHRRHFVYSNDVLSRDYPITVSYPLSVLDGDVTVNLDKLIIIHQDGSSPDACWSKPPSLEVTAFLKEFLTLYKNSELDQATFTSMVPDYVTLVNFLTSFKDFLADPNTSDVYSLNLVKGRLTASVDLKGPAPGRIPITITSLTSGDVKMLLPSLTKHSEDRIILSTVAYVIGMNRFKLLLEPKEFVGLINVLASELRSLNDGYDELPNIEELKAFYRGLITFYRGLITSIRQQLVDQVNAIVDESINEQVVSEA